MRILTHTRGGAALLVVGESTIADAIDKAHLKAEKHVAKELNADATTRASWGTLTCVLALPVRMRRAESSPSDHR